MRRRAAPALLRLYLKCFPQMSKFKRSSDDALNNRYDQPFFGHDHIRPGLGAAHRQTTSHFPSIQGLNYSHHPVNGTASLSGTNQFPRRNSLLFTSDFLYSLSIHSVAQAYKFLALSNHLKVYDWFIVGHNQLQVKPDIPYTKVTI